MKRIVCESLLLLVLVPATGCMQPSTAAPAAKTHHAPLHRFEHLSLAGQAGVALDSVTGQWCKTWEWTYRSDKMNGSLDTLPTCLSLYNTYPIQVEDE